MRKLKVSELVEGTIFTIPGNDLMFKLMGGITYDRATMNPLSVLFGNGDKMQRVAVLRGQQYQTYLSTFIGTQTETDLDFPA